MKEAINMAERTYLCIDLKSFYASVECVDRDLDPMTTNLIVADPERSEGTICLAVSPAMKALGVSNRCRVFEIPKNISYIPAPPRMQHYINCAADIYGIYLNYIAAEDIHVYSIDEVFLDVTHYLNLYKKTAKEMALLLMGEIEEKIGIRATCGIGPNLYLAKIALDIIAKKAPVIHDLGETDFGTFELVGKRCYVTVAELSPKPFPETKLEGHKKYLDIQLTEGPVRWGVCSSKSEKIRVLEEYDPGRDIWFCLSDDTVYYDQAADSPSIFVFFPKNLHNPSFAAEGVSYETPLKKIVVKVEYAE